MNPTKTTNRLVRLCRIALLGGLLVAAPVLEASSSGPLNPISLESDVALYYGTFTRTNFGQILMRGQTNYEPSHLLAATFNRSTGSTLSGVQFETEAQVVKHFGLQEHMEFNGLLVARLPSVLGLPVNVAFGEGLSYATANPPLENPRKDLFNPMREQEFSRPLLNYLMVELEVDADSRGRFPTMFVRVHHRSGVFGTYCPPTCGSNFIAYGIRMPIRTVGGYLSFDK